MVEYLLQRGAIVNARSIDNDTPLHIAAYLEADKSPDKIVEILRKYGGNRFLTNDNGKTPLDLATLKGRRLFYVHMGHV